MSVCPMHVFDGWNLGVVNNVPLVSPSKQRVATPAVWGTRPETSAPIRHPFHHPKYSTCDRIPKWIQLPRFRHFWLKLNFLMGLDFSTLLAKGPISDDTFMDPRTQTVNLRVELL